MLPSRRSSRAASPATTLHVRSAGAARPVPHLLFLGLSVIPHLKITDRGLVDVDRFELFRSGCDDALRQAVGSSPATTRGPSTPPAGCLVAGGFIAAVGEGPEPEADTREELGGAVVTPGLVKTHHHLYQTLTRARAQQADLFGRLRELYPVWARIDAEAEYAAARTGLAGLALSGCTTAFDHHYVFPRGREGLVEAEVQAARELGVRIVASRGSMDLGASDGGLPPTSWWKSWTTCSQTPSGSSARSTSRPEPACRSPSPVLPVLGHEAAHAGVGVPRKAPRPPPAHAPGRDDGRGRVLPGAVRLHARRVPDRPRLARLGRVVRALRSLSADDVADFAASNTGIAHCPTSNLRLGAGVAPVRELLDEGVRVGLGVDGSASNERSDLLEVKQALLVARGRAGRRR